MPKGNWTVPVVLLFGFLLTVSGCSDGEKQQLKEYLSLHGYSGGCACVDKCANFSGTTRGCLDVTPLPEVSGYKVNCYCSCTGGMSTGICQWDNRKVPSGSKLPTVEESIQGI